MPEQQPHVTKTDGTQESVPAWVPIWDLVRYYLRLGALGFGGPVALLSLIVLFRWNVNNPALVAVAAIIGLIAFPLLQPVWVFVK